MKVSLYNPESDKSDWDLLIQSSNNGVFLHTRKFLSYHRDRFADQSLVFKNDKGQLIALLPAALDRSNPSMVISHPGITYGGIIHNGRMSIETIEEMLTLALEEYKLRGITELTYKCVPIHLQTKQTPIDEYLLWRNGATIARRDLWNVILLNGSRTLSKIRRRCIAKAQNLGLIIENTDSDDGYFSFHKLLTECLNERYQVQPVHNREEMCILRNMFPDQISLWIIKEHNGNILAGTWIFKFGTIAWHTQYIASSEAGRSCHALDLLFETIIKMAEDKRVNFFSFGASTERQGRDYNSGLFNFKAGFGFGVVKQDMYQINL